MPWQNYGKMTDADLKAMFAYLQSIPPIRNRVPEPDPGRRAPRRRPAAAPGRGATGTGSGAGQGEGATQPAR